MVTKSNIEQYELNGYTYIDNFLPEKVATDLEKIYAENTKWDLIDQVRETHYQHVMKTESPYFPNGDEIFYAKFYRSNHLEKETYDIFEEYFKPTMKEFYKDKIMKYDYRCYKFDKDCHLRTHIDDYTSMIGTTYYINKKWMWDWGGILHVGSETEFETLDSILPKFNRLVIMNHGVFRFPHFVSPITEFAQNQRYTMVSFNE